MLPPVPPALVSRMSYMRFPGLPNLPDLPSFPNIEINPLPETIFQKTVQGFLHVIVNLSRLDTVLLLIILVLLQSSPSARPTANFAVGIVSLILGLEIASINAYLLVCSWISPDTTLEPLTITYLGIINSMTPILTDAVLLYHVVVTAAAHSTSMVSLIAKMAAPVTLKFVRLANAGMYIYQSTQAVLSASDVFSDFPVLEIVQTRSAQIACGLQMVDNVYVANCLRYYPVSFMNSLAGTH
ncbi:hypothetical protein BV25DRAFT_365529 [Artomyces pyxidatus]|uniref:Uncharacterized protein n=1 Tax=Artomyces pyxidatus TaxID=48021 RepID=A0ACB8T5L2_9AGAM|nr:hypothetical protein BV25DRAFT_365529 [Artomyces pyxidatus]